MSAGVSKSLEEQLSLASKQVDLLLAIDAACDNAVDDREALTAAVALITQALEAEVGLLSWFDPDIPQLAIRLREAFGGALAPRSWIVCWPCRSVTGSKASATSLQRCFQIFAVLRQPPKRSRRNYWCRCWPQLPPIGIGIDTGEVIIGNFGSAQRLEYTAIAHHINLAARLCRAAEGHQILISAATYELVCNQIEAEPVAALHLKGIGEAVAAYQV